MFYMHVHGHGSPAELARKVKPALDLIGKGGRPALAPAPGAPADWGTGPADKLASAFKAALAQLGTPKNSAAKH